MRTNVIKTGLVVGAALAFALSVVHAASAADKEIVSYRLTQWKTLHFENPEQAAKHVDALKQLDCQIKQDSHAGHIDVSYYCPQWKQGAVATHAMAHEWQNWLRSAGFETRHAH